MSNLIPKSMKLRVGGYPELLGICFLGEVVESIMRGGDRGLITIIRVEICPAVAKTS